LGDIVRPNTFPWRRAMLSRILIALALAGNAVRATEIASG
jgi:hypothetical protein